MKKLFLIFILTLISFGAKSQLSLDTLRDKDSTLSSFIDEWIGAKYRVGGLTKSGVDCSGFSMMLYKNVYDIVLPRIAKEQFRKTIRVKKDSLKTGDLVFFRTRSRTGWHVGVYLFDNYFIHSANHKTGVKINNLTESYYTQTYLSGGRI